MHPVSVCYSLSPPDGVLACAARQIATVANEEFRELYGLEDVGEYAARKSAIFSRYRLLAEMVGALLLKVDDAAYVLACSSDGWGWIWHVRHGALFLAHRWLATGA
jgi:hypothetical protein